MGNREQEMRLDIFDEILHSEQFEGAEFTSGNTFLWFLTLANVGAVIFEAIALDEEWEMRQFWRNFILCTNRGQWIQWWQHFFSNFWRLSILTLVNLCTCHLLGHSFGSFGRRATNASILMKFCTRHKMRVVNSIVTIVFWDFRRLSDLTLVNISTCHLLGHSYEGWWIQWWQ